MEKTQSDSEQLLQQLGKLSSFLTRFDTTDANCFDRPLDIMRKAMGFDVSVLYKITNQIEDFLILEVAKKYDPQGIRPDLIEGSRFSINLARPVPIYVNESRAFKEKKISDINVPGVGCDLVGFVYLPESFGGGYLFGGDFFGAESSIQEYEVGACEIMCNLLSSILMKTQFEKLAIYDGLTGLINSRTIRERLEQAFYRAHRQLRRGLTIVLCDVDHFKSVNDQYGHIQGDSVLQEIGTLLSSSTRNTIDQAGRYGGEEFLLIFDENRMDGTDRMLPIIERLRAAIESHPFKKIGKNGKSVPGEFIRVTMSFGVAAYYPGMKIERVEELLSRADAALYASKKNGRNRVTVDGTKGAQRNPAP